MNAIGSINEFREYVREAVSNVASLDKGAQDMDARDGFVEVRVEGETAQAIVDKAAGSYFMRMLNAEGQATHVETGSCACCEGPHQSVSLQHYEKDEAGQVVGTTALSMDNGKSSVVSEWHGEVAAVALQRLNESFEAQWNVVR
jgi:hypothetical protein